MVQTGEVTNDPATSDDDSESATAPDGVVPPTATSKELPWRTEVLLLIVLGLLLRITKIVATEPWLDEACSIELARHGPVALLQTLGTTDASPHPPLYFLILSGVISLLGDAVGPARLPSLFAGLGLVAGTAEAARRVAGRWPGRIAGLIAVVSPLAIHYSVEARSYSLLAMLCLALALTAQRLVSDWQVKTAIALAALGLAAGLTHYFALFIVPLPLLLAVPSRGGSAPDANRPAGASTTQRELIIRALKATALLAVAMAPALWLVVGQLQRGAGGTSWLRPLPSVFGAFVSTLEAMAIGTHLPQYLGHAGMIRMGAPSHALGLGFLGTGALVGMLWPLSAPYRGPRRALVAVAGLAIGAPLLLSLWRPLYLPGRYELAAMAPLHALAAVGWWQVANMLRRQHVRREQFAGWILCLVVVGLSVGYLPRYLTLHTVQPFTLLTSNIIRGSTPARSRQSAVILTRLTGPPTTWQLRQTEYSGLTRYFPAEQGQHPCWVDRASSRDPALADEAKTLARELQRAGVRRLFVIVTLRGRHTLAPAGLLLNTLKVNGWKMKGGRRMDTYGIVIFKRKG